MDQTKKLIVNCDDFGQSPAMNKAIMHLLEEGKVSSATVMTPAPAFEEAAAWCRAHPEAPVGLHLTFTSEFTALRWPSLTKHPSLHDETGHLWMTVDQFALNAEPAAVEAEMEAQFLAAEKHGISVTHADNHMGSLYGLTPGAPSYLPNVFQQCARRGLPFRMFRRAAPDDPLAAGIPDLAARLAQVTGLADQLGVPLVDYLLSHPFHIEENETYDTFKRTLIEKLYRLPDGIVETYIHPGAEDAWMSEHIPHWEKRVWEFRLMFDDDWAYALKDANVELVDYRILRKS